MLTRRQLFMRSGALAALGATARSAVAQPRAAGDRAATDLVIGVAGLAHTRVMFSDDDRSVLSAILGVRGRLLLAAESVPHDREALSIVMGQRYAMLRWRPTGHACRITLPSEPSSFVTSWALPLLSEGGLIGYSPHEEVPFLLSSDAGSYHVIARDLPAGLERASDIYACFFGDWEIADIQAQLDRLETRVDPSAHVVVTTAVDEAHAPVMLMTTFAGVS